MPARKRLSDPTEFDKIDGEEDDTELDSEENDDDEDLAELGGSDSLDFNETQRLPKPREIGGGKRAAELYGQNAEYMGRTSSPRLYAQASAFPTCVSLRVWKIDNGVPVGIGTIEAEATEEDFVRTFKDAMPKKGERRSVFKIRPIDIRGHELGQEAMIPISEFHTTIQEMRRSDEEERSQGGPNQIIVERNNNEAQNTIATQLSSMMEHMLATAEDRVNILEASLNAERERVRDEELRRAKEQVDLASSAATGVQAITERMMRDESERAKRGMELQNNQSQTLVTTLSSIFSQQSMMSQQAAEERRRADEERLRLDRERYERDRQDAEDRRRRERDEADEKRKQEREEIEHRLKLEREEASRKAQQQQFELQERLLREREESQRRLDELKLENIRKAEEAKAEASRRSEEIRLEAERREKEADRRMTQYLEDLRIRAQQEKDEAERRRSMERDEAERRKQEFELRMSREREEMLARKEELELRLNREREETRAKEQREREDRESRERWLREERELKEKREREEYILREEERKRQHDRMMKDMEIQATKDREHAERMMTLAKQEMTGNGNNQLFELAGTAMAGLQKFGIEPTTLLQKLLAPEEQETNNSGQSWMSAIPQIISAVGSMAAMAATRQQPPAPMPRMLPQPVPDMQAAPTPTAPPIHAQSAPKMYPNRPKAAQPVAPPVSPGFEPPEHQDAVSSSSVMHPNKATERDIADVSIPPNGSRRADRGPVTTVTEATELKEINEMIEISEESIEQLPAVEVAPAESFTSVRPLADLARERGLTNKAQRAARARLKTLVRDMGRSPESDWEGLITSALVEETTIYHYAQVVSVRAVLLEAGATPELADRIIENMKNSTLVPKDLSYEMDDADSLAERKNQESHARLLAQQNQLRNPFGVSE